MQVLNIGFYVLLPYIIYVMQSGRFSQYPADGKRAGLKVQCKITVAVQKVKPLYFLSRSFAVRCGRYSLCLNNPTGQRRQDGGFREGGIGE